MNRDQIAKLDLRNPDDHAAWWEHVAEVNAKPVPVVLPPAKRHHRPITSVPTVRAYFAAEPPPPRCGHFRPHLPHQWGLRREHPCDGGAVPQRRRAHDVTERAA